MSDLIDIDQLKKTLQDFADQRDWQKFHNPKNLAMALAGEAGELLEIFQWLTEAESIQAHQDPDIHKHTSHELADILLYLIRIADQMKINLSQAIHDKLILNNRKYPAELVRGSSKKKYDQ